MADKGKTGDENAPGGRNTEPGGLESLPKGDGKELTGPVGFGLNGEDVRGSLKIHVKLDLEADIRVIARVKGDIAIGLL